MSRGRSESCYYGDSGAIPFASRLSLRVRRKMFQLFMDVIHPALEARVARRGGDER
jgi:hypothetical protein